MQTAADEPGLVGRFLLRQSGKAGQSLVASQGDEAGSLWVNDCSGCRHYRMVRGLLIVMGAPFPVSAELWAGWIELTAIVWSPAVQFAVVRRLVETGTLFCSKIGRPIWTVLKQRPEDVIN